METPPAATPTDPPPARDTALAPRPATLPRWLETGTVVCLLALFVGLCGHAAWQQSHTFDEIAHLTAGYSYWRLNEYNLNPESGNLPQRLAGLPLLTQRVNWPSPAAATANGPSVYDVGPVFLFQSGNDLDHLFHLARLGMLVVALGLGLTVHGYARRLFGPRAALLSLAVFALCPTMLAHGAMVAADMTAALFFLLASWCLWELCHLITPWRLAAAGLAVGGLCLAKFSAVLIAPIAGVLLVARLLRCEPLPVGLGRRRWHLAAGRRAAAGLLGALAAVALMAWLLIWAAYGGRYAAWRAPTAAAALPASAGFVQPWTTLGEHSPVLRLAVETARRAHLLPEAYLYGFLYTIHHAAGRQAFLHGRVKLTGWWWFFPYAVLVKTPLAVFGFVALALVLVPWRRLGPALYRTLPLWTLLAVYWAAALTSHLNIGHRHVLLTYPTIYVLLGAIVPAWLALAGWRRRLVGGVIAALLVALAADTLAVRPHVLAVFNRAAGGPANGYRHLVDSSLDWGQSLPALRQWLAQHAPPGPTRPPVYLSYFGTANPERFALDAVPLPNYDLITPVGAPVHFTPLRPGLYCISATLFASVCQVISGPWNDVPEGFYQELRRPYEERLAAGADPADARDLPPGLAQRYAVFPALRFARLCAWLRAQDRPPDAQAGYSILIFRLSADDLRAALAGPPPRDPLRLCD